MNYRVFHPQLVIDGTWDIPCIRLLQALDNLHALEAGELDSHAILTDHLGQKKAHSEGLSVPMPHYQQMAGLP